MKKISTRLLSALLSVVMVVTMLPAFALTATAAEGDKYLFAYFCGDDKAGKHVSNQKIRFAVSEDGINYSALNDNLPILSNVEGSLDALSWNSKWGKYGHTDGARDPFIINKRDSQGNITSGYYVVATDLAVTSVQGSYNNTKMLVWDIPDISKADEARPWVIETAGLYGNNNTVANADNAIAWAPEVTWDYEKNMYCMIYAGARYDSANMKYMYTADFRSFVNSNGEVINGDSVKPQELTNFRSGVYTIDGNIVHDNGKYYLTYKREDGSAKGTIWMREATTIPGLTNATDHKFVDSEYYGDPMGLEGPEVYQLPNGHWVLIADNYTLNPICNFVMWDLGTSMATAVANAGNDHIGNRITTNMNTLNPRHGYVAKISDAEYNALIANYAGYDENVNADMVARYFTTSDVTYDATTHGYTLTNNGTVYVEKDGKPSAYFNNSGMDSNNSSVKYTSVSTQSMNNNYVFSAKQGVTIKWNAYDDGNAGTRSEYANLFNISKYTGNPGGQTYDESTWVQNATNDVYVSSQLSAGIMNGVTNESGRTTIDAKRVATGAWHTYKAVIGLNGMQVYRDNTLIESVVLEGINDAWFADTFGNGILRMGVSLFGTDKAFNGYINDFRIYNTSNQELVARIDNPPVVIPASEAVTTFENYLKSGNVYTNINDAYQAYVKYNAAIDAKYYGGNESVDVDSYAQQLADAVENMKVWTGDVTTKPGTYYGYEAVSKGEYSYHNVIYTDSRNEADWSGPNGTDGNNDVGTYGRFKYALPRAVLVYNANADACGAPIILQYTSLKNAAFGARPTINFRAAFMLSDTRVKLTHDWWGNAYTDGKGDSAWNTWSVNRFNSVDKAMTLSYRDTSTNVQYYAKTSEVYHAANELYFNAENGFEDNDGYSSSAKGNEITVRINVGGSYGNMYNNNAAIYTINYKKFYDTAKTNIDTTKLDLSNYKQGGLTTYFSKIDSITSLDPINYFGSGVNNDNLDTAVNNCANALKAAANTNFDSITKTVDNAAYQATRDAIDLDLSGSASNYELDSCRTEYKTPNVKYTDASYTAFKNAYTAAQTDMAKPLTDGYKTDFASTDANTLDKAYKSLMPKADPSSLVDMIDTKEVVIADSIFEGGTQKYAFNSWSTIEGAIETAQTIVNNSSSNEKYNKNGDTTTDFYSPTAYQTSIESTATTLGTAEYQECDTEVYDSALAVIEAMDKEKFAPAQMEALQASIDQYNTGADRTDDYVYLQVTEADVAADGAVGKYNAATGDTVASGDKIVAATVAQTDAITTKLLTQMNNLTVNEYTCYLTVEDNAGSTVQARHLVATKSYGEMFNISVGDVTNKTVTWTVSATDKKGVHNTRVISDYEGGSIDRIADADIDVVATISEDAPSDTIVLKVLNAYMNVSDVIYASSAEDKAALEGKDATAASVVDHFDIVTPSYPLYTFKEWKAYKQDGVYYLEPVFVPSSASSISIVTPSDTKSVEALSRVTIEHTEPNFVAWAVDNGDDTYDIVSYNETYSFTALCDETYTEIINDGGVYKVNGVALTASMVKDCQNTSGQKLTDDQFLVRKLDAKMPFTSVQYVETYSEGGKDKVKVYCRATAGSTVEPKAVGVLVNNGTKTLQLNVSAVSDSGQYYASFNTKPEYTYTSFVTYEFDYLGYDVNIQNHSAFVK